VLEDEAHGTELVQQHLHVLGSGVVDDDVAAGDADGRQVGGDDHAVGDHPVLDGHELLGALDLQV